MATLRGGTFFFATLGGMPNFSDQALSDLELQLKAKFATEGAPISRLPSTADDLRVSDRTEDIMLDDAQRQRMPFTADKYLVKENPALVAWERETRKFLRNLSPIHGHRVSASMVYEWATGIQVKDLIAGGGSTTDLRKINQILKYYYGDPKMTYICGRKVPKAYRVPPGFYIRRHRPMTLTLYAEYAVGTLYP